MKTEDEIRQEIVNRNEELEKTKKEYRQLNQIDMLSSTGTQLQAKIIYLRGLIVALTWVIYK
jgi:hypothetical protein